MRSSTLYVTSTTTVVCILSLVFVLYYLLSIVFLRNISRGRSPPSPAPPAHARKNCSNMVRTFRVEVKYNNESGFVILPHDSSFRVRALKLLLESRLGLLVEDQRLVFNSHVRARGCTNAHRHEDTHTDAHASAHAVSWL